MRRLIAVPGAVLLSLALASSAFAAFCGNGSKPEGAGQKVVLLVDFRTDPPTTIVVEGANAAGRWTGAFADVYLDFDFNGEISAGDCFIDDTFIISEHSGHIATGQLLDGLGVLPPLHRGQDPGGAGSGAGFAATANCPF